ncbi:MAG: hypothetical protein DRJ40_03725 [Thermoprotei archaeon]|nr:MAG: hypothetical protein DRJ40_03725 [Thermoprotei archaeon]
MKRRCLVRLRKYVLDTVLWVEYLIGSDVGKVIAKIIENPQVIIIVPLTQLAELHYVVLRTLGEDVASEFTSTVLSETVVDVGDPQTYLLAAELKARYFHNLSLSECILVATARKFSASLVLRSEVINQVKEMGSELGIEVLGVEDIK